MERLTYDDGDLAVCYGCDRKGICHSLWCVQQLRVIAKLVEYEKTGLAPEQVRELVEKQKPMKVEKLKSAQYPYRCPACGYLLEIGYKHCISCGQRLEYEKEEVK